MTLFHGNTLPHPMERCRQRYWWACKVNRQTEGYEQNDDRDCAKFPGCCHPCGTVMPTTTVLHVSQADIDYILFIRSVEPWDDMQAIAEFAVYKADLCMQQSIAWKN